MLSLRKFPLGRLAPILGLCLALGAPVAAKAAPSKDDLMVQAKAQVAQLGLPCAVSEARRAEPDAAFSGGRGGRGGRGGGGGGNSDATGRGAAGRRPSFVEIACAEGLGFILIEPPAERAKASKAADPPPSAPIAGPADFVNCLEAAEANRLRQLPVRCELKANADPRKALQALAARVGVPCEVQAGRGLGHTEANSFFEVACAKSPEETAQHREAVGYVLIAGRLLPADGAVTAFSCFDVEINPKVRCTLTRVTDVVAALRRFVSKAQATCQPVAVRLVGPAATGQVFEVACANRDDYLALRRQKDQFDDLVSCREQTIAHQCQLLTGPPAPGAGPRPD